MHKFIAKKRSVCYARGANAGREKKEVKDGKKAMANQRKKKTA